MVPNSSSLGLVRTGGVTVPAVTMPGQGVSFGTFPSNSTASGWRCGPDGMYCDNDPHNTIEVTLGENIDSADNERLTTLPDHPRITALPVASDYLQGVQWFGGTYNAWLLWNQGSDVYQYCHYFHCGLDLLAPWGTPVIAGTSGIVIYSGCSPNNYEGPCKVQVEVETNTGVYVITYGHLGGEPAVRAGEYVHPNTVIGVVGNNSRPLVPDGAFNHLHFEIRGPGGWGGNSLNPILYMSDEDVTTLIKITHSQTVEPAMAVYYDDGIVYTFPPPDYLMPNSINRYTTDPYFTHH